MGRKSYTDLDDLMSDLDNHSFSGEDDEDTGHLEDEDLALLQNPTIYPPSPPQPSKRLKVPTAKKPAKRKKK